MIVAEILPMVNLVPCVYILWLDLALYYLLWYYIGYYQSKTLHMPTANSAFMKPMTLSPELEAVIGKGPMPRSEVVKALWIYIKKHDLQDPKNKRNIVADEKLNKVFDGKGTVTMFEMTKLVSKHLS